MSPVAQTFPRSLTAREREWINWILPDDRPGYAACRSVLQSMVVLGDGRRGAGEIILGTAGREIDISAPLAPVLAYGVIETNFGAISITLREVFDEQISVEIVNHRGEDVPERFEEIRRWTYSTWKPGDSCPQCGSVLREVPMHTLTAAQEQFDLALCGTDRRLWVYEASTQVNRLIPVTNFYNELMLHKNIRDPKVALDSKRLFAHLSSYTDNDLTYAFLTYNKLKTKVHLTGMIQADRAEQPGFFGKLKHAFVRHA